MRALFSMLILLSLGAGLASAQPEVQVGKIDPIQVIWGPQTIYAQVTNLADYPKFLSATVRIAFKGRYLNPKRNFRTNFVLEPSATVAMPIKMDIPPNFGEANATVEIYDVVDTLDRFFADQKLTEQHSRLLFTVPDSLFDYMQERITMPPFTENAPMFDNEVSRLAFLFFRDGKSDVEIARLTKIDTMYLRQMIWKWKYYEFLAVSKVDSTLRPTFPFITTAEAEEVKPLADKLAEQLATHIRQGMKGYNRVMDSLVAAGTLTKDSNDVLNGGTVLYRPYPVINGLLLWYSLGRGFIAGTQPIDFLAETDPCNTLYPQWMYAVIGGDLFNGHQWASFTVSYGSPVVQFADSVPEIRCPEFSPYTDRLQPADWTYSPTGGPEIFTLDTGLVHPVLKAMSTGTEPYLQTAYDGLRTIIEKYEPGAFIPSVRWWFWNLVATRTNDLLLAKSVYKRRGNGYFRFEMIQK